jgi:sugar-specific transcriptional regulator TrmB
MDKNEIVGEQLSDFNGHTATAGIDEGTSLNDGSPLGKFKNAESLLDAYNELQSEFTRKCQKLSEAEKKLQENTENQMPESGEGNFLNKFAWNKNFDEFMQSHKNANLFMEEMTNEIINDEALKDMEDGLERAYYRAIEKKFIPHDELANNKDFLENFIYNNEEIKNKIIKEYITSLQNFKSPITISNSGSTRGVAMSTNISTLEDAKSVVESMFKF